MRRAFCGAVGLLATIVSLPARAQDVSIADLASELLYDSCMEYLAGELSLASASQLKAKGFSDQPESKQHPRHGLIEIVTAKRGDTEIAFGGRPEKMCILMITGPDRLLARDAVKNGMTDISIKMSPVPVPQPGSGITHEGFKGKVEPDLYFNITLLTVPDTAAKAPVAMTAFFTSE